MAERAPRMYPLQRLGAGERYTLNRARHRHLSRLLRPKAGAELTLFDARGGGYAGGHRRGAGAAWLQSWWALIVVWIPTKKGGLTGGVFKDTRQIDDGYGEILVGKARDGELT